MRGLSEAIKCVLTPLGVKVVFRPLRTLRQMLVRPKDPVPVEEHKGVVYSISCVECSSVYIGQTGRSLKQCVSEHRRALKYENIQTSALAEHVFKTGHAVDLSQPEVLDQNNPTQHHTLHVGELVHPAQPGSLEQRVRNPTGSVCGTPGLMGMYPLITLFCKISTSITSLYFTQFPSILTALTDTPTPI